MARRKLVKPACRRRDGGSGLNYVLDRAMRDWGLGKGVKKGRIWAYVQDQRPFAALAPPGAVYHFTPDWRQEHLHHHLRVVTKRTVQLGKYYEAPSIPVSKDKIEMAQSWNPTQAQVKAWLEFPLSKPLKPAPKGN